MAKQNGAGPALAMMQELISSQDVCVLATFGKEGPHTSLMAYLSDLDTGSIYLITRKSTKKFANLSKHPQVSLLIDDRQAASPEDRSLLRALTVSGWARVLEAEAGEMVKRQFLEKMPHLAKLIQAGDSVVIAVEISSLQLLEGPEKSTVHILDRNKG